MNITKNSETTEFDPEKATEFLIATMKVIDNVVQQYWMGAITPEEAINAIRTFVYKEVTHDTDNARSTTSS